MVRAISGIVWEYIRSWRRATFQESSQKRSVGHISTFDEVILYIQEEPYREKITETLDGCNISNEMEEKSQMQKL